MNSLKIPDGTQRGFQQKPALVLPAPLTVRGDGWRDCSGVGLLWPGSHPRSCSPAPGHAGGGVKVLDAASASGFLLVCWELWTFSLKEFEVVHI